METSPPMIGCMIQDFEQGGISIGPVTPDLTRGLGVCYLIQRTTKFGNKPGTQSTYSNHIKINFKKAL